MKIKTIQYSQSKESSYEGLKRWDKVGIEAELEEGDKPVDVFMELKAKTTAWLEPIVGGTIRWQEQPSIQPLQSIDYKAKEKLEIDIDNATSLEELHKLHEGAVKYELVDAYHEKVKQLFKTTLQ